MKRILLPIAFILAFAASAFAQGGNVPITIREVDGSPRITNPSGIIVSNGTLTVQGRNAVITTGGGGGTGCVPSGSAGQLLYDDGAGACSSSSGLTATGSTVTIVSGVTATFSRAGLLYTGTVTTDNASVQTQIIQGDRATVAANDEAYITYRLSNAAGTQTEVARQTWAIPTATAASENGRIDWSVMTGGALAKELQLAGADLSPSTSDGLALGTTSLQWSDLFLASGAVINFANGNAVLTHSSGILTVSTGDLRVTTAGTNAASVATLDGVQTLANKTITAATNTLGSVTMDVTGTDADGDTYYRASNVLTRLPKGTAGQVLTMNAGATAPEWGAGTSGADPTASVGLTAVNGVATTYLRSDGAPALDQGIVPTWTGTHTFNNGVTTGTGSTAGTVFTYNSLTTGNGADVSSSSVTSGNVVSIAATGTAAASNTKTALNVSTSGANGTSTQTTFGARFSNTSTGTSSTNIGASFSASGGSTNYAIQSNAAIQFPGNITLVSGSTTVINADSSNVALNGGIVMAGDLRLRRGAAANLAFGAADAASPVAQTLSFQGGTGTNTAGATATIRGSLGTSQGVPGRVHLAGGALIAASGTTTQTAVDRIISGATKVLTNNSAVTIANVTAASNTVAGGQLGYLVEVTDGTDVAYETGVVSFGISNKAGVFTGNTATKFGNHQNATGGSTLTVTFAISGANPALLSVNANSSLSPSTGYPRITYWLMNGAQQAVAVQ